MSDKYDFFASTSKGASEVTLTPVSPEAMKFIPELFPDLKLGQSVVYSLRDLYQIVDLFIPPHFSIKWLPPLRPPSSSSPRTPSSAPSQLRGKTASTMPITTPQQKTEEGENAPSASPKASKIMSRLGNPSVLTAHPSQDLDTPLASNTMRDTSVPCSYLTTSNKKATKRWKKVLRSYQHLSLPRDGEMQTVLLQLPSQ